MSCEAIRITPNPCPFALRYTTNLALGVWVLDLSSVAREAKTDDLEVKEMKRSLPIFLSLLAASASAFAQDQATIDKALTAAPAQMKRTLP